MPASHFSNPLVEQRDLLSGRAAVELDDLAVLVVSGADRLPWLHSLLSQNLRSLASNESSEALLLDPQGHIEQVIKIFESGDSTFLMVSQDSADSLEAWLRKMVFRMRVSIERKDSEYAAFAFFGDHNFQTQPVLIWEDRWPEPRPGSLRYSKTTSQPWNYKIALVARTEKALVESEFTQAGQLALNAIRIAAHRPEFSHEVDEKSLPHELDWLASAVHLSKGCYRGQETVAKVHNLGHPPRRLVLLHLDGSEHSLPNVGDLVLQAGNPQTRGRITSVAQHFEMGPIALAVIARTVPVNEQLLVQTEHGQIAATQEVIVPPDAGKTAELPKRNLLMGGRK